MREDDLAYLYGKTWQYAIALFRWFFLQPKIFYPNATPETQTVSKVSGFY